MSVVVLDTAVETKTVLGEAVTVSVVLSGTEAVSVSVGASAARLTWGTGALGARRARAAAMRARA